MSIVVSVIGKRTCVLVSAKETTAFNRVGVSISA
jgi:hypothetical protein